MLTNWQPQPFQPEALAKAELNFEIDISKWNYYAKLSSDELKAKEIIQQYD